jgi:hypothetical protein
MTTPTAIEINCETGEVTERPLTADEISANEAAQAKAEADALAAEAEAEALATLKASAKAKLISGKPLTAEEADTLVI